MRKWKACKTQLLLHYECYVSLSVKHIKRGSGSRLPFHWCLTHTADTRMVKKYLLLAHFINPPLLTLNDTEHGLGLAVPVHGIHGFDCLRIGSGWCERQSEPRTRNQLDIFLCYSTGGKKKQQQRWRTLSVRSLINRFNVPFRLGQSFPWCFV